MAKIEIELPPMVEDGLRALNEIVVFEKENYEIANAWIFDDQPRARCLINFGAIRLGGVGFHGITYCLTETGKQLYIAIHSK